MSIEVPKRRKMQTLEVEFDIMAALKSSTAPQHKAVEQLMPFFKPGFTLQQYTDMLAAFLGFFEPLEAELVTILGWPTIGIDLSHRQRAHFLRRDLRVLGLSDSAIAAIPRCDDLPEMKNRYNGLGCLYVLEGSTLGGQLIARELSRCFNIDETSGASFFLSHGSHTGEMWKEYCAMVRTYVNDPIKQQAAVHTAAETFEKFDLWMREAGLNAE
jgi:heme oxygenase